MYSLIPRPFQWRRRKGLVHTALACTGVPQKNVGIRYHRVFVYSSICHPYNCMYTGNLGQVTMETRPAAMEKPAHTRTLCIMPFLLLNLKGLDARLEGALIMDNCYSVI